MYRKRNAIILLTISILGFIYSSTIKSKKEVYNKKSSSLEIQSDKFNVNKNDTYKFAFSVTDEESSGFAPWPLAEATISILKDNDELLIIDTIADGGFIDVGVKRAMAIQEYNVDIDFYGDLLFKYQLIAGQECELIVYKNIEDWRNLLPALFVITFVISVFWGLNKKQK